MRLRWRCAPIVRFLWMLEVIQASRNSIATDEETEADDETGEEDWPDVIGDASDLPM